ncbi:MAG: hypothetical protein WBD99_06320 [Thermodesulfobacteriota bacterium]
MVNNGPNTLKEQASKIDRELSDLKKLVNKHRVCWEVWPLFYLGKDGVKVQIGFDLEIFGTHSNKHPTLEPGSQESAEILKDLKKVAEFIIPRDKQYCRSEIQVFDNLIQFSPLRKFRDDFTVGIKITHRSGYERPVDACEIECLKQIEERLKQLGAQKGHWKYRN